MIEYTVEVTATGAIVHDRKMRAARLTFHGGGVNVYVLKRKGARRAYVDYLAMELAQRHNVPLMQFRRVTRGS